MKNLKIISMALVITTSFSTFVMTMEGSSNDNTDTKSKTVSETVFIENDGKSTPLKEYLTEDATVSFPKDFLAEENPTELLTKFLNLPQKKDRKTKRYYASIQREKQEEIPPKKIPARFIWNYQIETPGSRTVFYLRRAIIKTSNTSFKEFDENPWGFNDQEKQRPLKVTFKEATKERIENEIIENINITANEIIMMQKVEILVEQKPKKLEPENYKITISDARATSAFFCLVSAAVYIFSYITKDKYF